MSAERKQVAKIAAVPLLCEPRDVTVRLERVPWIRRMRAYRATGMRDGPFPFGLMIVMPNGADTPPLILAAEPVWNQHWIASAVLRVEGVEPVTWDARMVAEIARTTLSGPGGKLITPATARHELAHPEPYDSLVPICIDPAVTLVQRRWTLRFTYVAPDGAIEGWQVAGSEHHIMQAECSLLMPPETWPGFPE